MGGNDEKEVVMMVGAIRGVELFCDNWTTVLR